MGKSEKIKTLLNKLVNRVSLSNKLVISGIAFTSGALVIHYTNKKKFSFRKLIRYTKSKVYSVESDSESDEPYDSENIQLELSENNEEISSEPEYKSFLGKLLFSKN